jgi:hypothetical protein
MALLVQVVIPISRSLEKIIIVHLDISLMFVWDVLFWENGFRRADRHAGSTINTGIRIYIEVSAPISIPFRAWDDAIYRADFYAVPFTGTKGGNNVSH